MDEKRRVFLEQLIEAAKRAADGLRAHDGDRDHQELIADIDALRTRIESELAGDMD